MSIAANMTFDTGSLDQDGTTDVSGTIITNPYASELAGSSATVQTIELTGTLAWVCLIRLIYHLNRLNNY